jgi:DNA-binding transcriptional ArsR family regulator
MNDDAVFRALADASRRRLLDRLHEDNGQTLGELCSGLDMTRQAVTKHLSILEAAHLVSCKRQGREKLHFINPVPINEIAERWIGKFERPRLEALADLRRRLESKDRGRQGRQCPSRCGAYHHDRQHIRLCHLHPHHARCALDRADQSRVHKE